MQNKLLITAALPYANGDLHIGFLLEAIQTDIYSRFNKTIGNDTLYICASDMHGTPIEINAKKAGLKPLQFATKYWKEHQQDLKKFHINFDNFYKTHSKENKEMAQWFFSNLKKKGYIYTKEIEQMYDQQAQRFLPDRFIKGTCPKCKTEDQYGDICESCGAAYNTSELLFPYSTLTNTTPIIKPSTHYFFKLSDFSTQLKKWIQNKKSNIQPEVRNSLQGWLKKGLKDWCISRDAPYFGFKIPNAKKETGAEKYFYVWLDAPIGYISSTINHTKKWKDYWYKGQVHHFIGKDIVYFHYLFWPAMFLALDIPLPRITTHGFVTINGKKMSKSRGTFFTAKDFYHKYGSEALRFYYAKHLNNKLVDIDLNLDDFQAVTNNVLMGNLGNFCYRTLTFANKNFSKITEIAKEKKIQSKIHTLIDQIKLNYQNLDFNTAVKNILQIADLGNQYFQQAEPWKNKQQAPVGFCVNLARNLAILISPILPEFSTKVYAALGEKCLQWNDLGFNWTGKVKKPQMLVKKIEQIAQQQIFPLQMKIGKIIAVKDHPNADSLYLLKVDFKTEQRQVVAGLKKHFPKNKLQGTTTVFCVNLKPAKLRGELSAAMILIAEDKKSSLLEVSGKPGDEINFKGLTNTTDEITFEQFCKLKMTVKDKKIYYDNKELVGVTTNNTNKARIR